MTATTRGLVNAHHHLYSSLARGMPSPPRAPRTFNDILELIWWRLDRALDLDLVRASARLGALEALEAGTTTIVDHHSSPNAIDGSLDVIRDACTEVGVRVVACYEVTDRNGPDGAKAGLAENERYLRAYGDGYVGAHACSTLSGETLDAVAGLAADLGVGVHIHVAEAASDGDAGERLGGHARDDWMLAHCVHLDRELPGTVLHNPRSNLNNSVGYARPARFGRVALGTDGIGSDLLEEFALAFALHRADDLDAAPDTAWSWLQWDGGAEVTWSYDQVEPWHVAYTPGIRPVRIAVDGDVVLADGLPCRVDPDEVRATARREARRLFERMEAL